MYGRFCKRHDGCDGSDVSFSISFLFHFNGRLRQSRKQRINTGCVVDTDNGSFDIAAADY
jgi:hypothetical protein